jgi:lipoprotein NlpI
MAPQQYKPVKILGDIAVASAAEKDMQTAGHEYYEEAVVLLEGSQDPSKYKSDAKEMYNYLGNYYLDMKNVSKAKEYFNKYLTLDPNNADYRKFVEGLK